MELTVVIPVYNRRDMLAQTLESLRRQTFKDFLVVICDDASTENIAEIARRFPDMEIEYLRFDRNAGQFGNAMRGLERCESPFVKFLHSDDLLFPEALGMQLKALREAPGAAMCLGGYLMFALDEDETIRVEDHYPLPFASPPRTKRQWAQLEGYTGYLPSACMFRTGPLREEGGFNTGLVGIADWEICVALSAKYPVTATVAPVCAYRHHGEQVTGSFFFDSEAAILSKDVLWLASGSNPLRDRLGLPKSQLAHLRYDAAWQNLRVALRSDRKGELFAKWLRFMFCNHLFLPFIMSFPLFSARKIRRRPKPGRKMATLEDVSKYQEVIRTILFADRERMQHSP